MGKKILIADDNPTFQAFIGPLLRRMGFEVSTAKTGVEVLKAVSRTRPDVIILDIVMPSLDGLHVLRYLKEDKASANTPVIMVSADAASETEEACRRLGCYEYLRKPIKIDRLHSVLQLCLFSGSGKSRRHLRTEFRGKVVVSFGAEQYELEAETLSEGGVYVRKDSPLPVGTRVDLAITLSDDWILPIRGSVIYVKETYGDLLRLSPGMAIKFDGISEDTAANLKDYIERLMAGGNALAGHHEEV